MEGIFNIIRVEMDCVIFVLTQHNRLLSVLSGLGKVNPSY